MISTTSVLALSVNVSGLVIRLMWLMSMN